MKASLFSRLAIAAIVFSGTVYAQTPTASGFFSIYNQNSANSGNYATGGILFYGANNVNSPATTYGRSGQCPTGDICPSPDPYVTAPLYWRPYDLLPNQFFASRPYDPILTNPWTLVLSSTSNFASGTTNSYTTPAVGNIDLMPFVQSMSVQGAGLTPTISWQLPSTSGLNVTVDQVRVRVFDLDNLVTTTNRGGISNNSFQNADFIFDAVVPTGQNTFQIPEAVNLEFGHSYSIAVAVEDLRADGTAQSRSQSFFDFTPLNTGNLNVYLPTFVPVPTTSGMTSGPLYGFNISGVSPDQVTFIDPLVATGFTFTKGTNDPNFRSVQIVSNIGDGFYDVYAWDGANWVLIYTNLAANETWNFGEAGLDRFQIRGIETSAGLNPFDLTAFVTGLTFVTAGNFTGTMQAMIADTSAVPEPGTLILSVLGLIICIGAYRHKS